MTIRRQVLILMAAALLLACSWGFLVKPSWGEPEISLFEALDLNGLWVDARMRQDYEKDHVPGAVLLNEDEWHSQLPVLLGEWSPGRVVVVYCSSVRCRSSHDVARRLREETGMEVKILKGGWRTWRGE